MELTKEDRNKIAGAVELAGLNPLEFAGPSEANKGDVRLIHEPSGSYFTVGARQKNYATRRVVQQVGDGPPDVFDAMDWLSRLVQWLDDVKRDLDTPDRWAELQEIGRIMDAEVVEDDEQDDDSPFSAEEQDEIARQLDSLKVQLEAQLSEAEARILAKQFEVIKDASKEMRRDRWVELVKGVLLGDIVNGQLPSPVVMRALSAAAQFVGHLHGLPQLPLGN